MKRVFDLSERQLVDSLITALSEHLKSTLTDAELEQFASRIYSRLVSDGVLGSTTVDTATHKESTVGRISVKSFF